MTDSVRERILSNIQATIAVLTDHFGSGTVERFKQSGNSFLSTCAHIGPGTETKTDNASGLTSCVLSGVVAVYTQSDISDENSETAMNAILKDIELALCSDITRGGIAVDTSVKSIQPIPTEEGQTQVCCILEFEVHYRHLTGDPTQAR